MRSGRRRAALYGILALSLAAALWAVPDTAPESGLSEPSSRPVRAVPQTRGAQQERPPGLVAPSDMLVLNSRARDVIAREDKNPFEVKIWTAAPAAVQASAQAALPPAPPPPEPSAPMLPFAFAGKLEVTPGKWVVYLTKGEQSLAVEMGETFEGVYRFDGIENDNVIIVYLPLLTKQLLPMGSAS